MPSSEEVEAVVDRIASTKGWNKRVGLIRQIPEDFGRAQHQAVYAAIAKAVYASELTPDFAYVHWRDEYELPKIERAYDQANALTDGFTNVGQEALEKAIQAAPEILCVFRLLLGFTTQEFAASTAIVAPQFGAAALSNSRVKAIEGGKLGNAEAAILSAAVIDQAMRGSLFAKGVGEVRSKIDKPDTIGGWRTVHEYATERVPFPVFLHQRNYGGAFRQLLDATSGKRGNLLEDAVQDLFIAKGIPFARTGHSSHTAIARKFGVTVKPAPDFIVHDKAEGLRAILECKHANDGGTARDKAARFAALRSEASRLGGVPLFGVLAGLGWMRTADTLGPVIRDTDGRVFTLRNLQSMITVEPFPRLKSRRTTPA